MKSLYFSTASLAAALLSLSSTAHAAAPELDPVVVVATRTPTPISQIGQSVTVLDAADIQSSQAMGVAELLQTTPGVTFARTGGPGQPSSVFIRGADSDHTLVLIDGVEMDDPSQPAGNFDFANLLVGDIARVEILRGAHSTLWGSQAIGGVVNIETTAPAKALEAQGEAQGGSFGTQSVKLGVGGASGPLSVRLAGGYFATDGIPAFDTRLGGSGDNGYRNTGLSGRLNYQIAPDASLDLRGYYTTAWVSLDGYDTPTGAFGFDGEYGKSAQYVGYGGLHFGLFQGALQNLVAVQYVDTDRRLYDPQLSAETFYGFGNTTRFEYQGALKLAPGYDAVFGAEHARSTLTTDSPAYDVVLSPITAHANQDSLYGQLKAAPLPGLNLEAGLRYDDPQAYGGHVTGQVSGVQSLNGGDTLIRASFGQGFKAPSLYQLFSPYGPLAQRLPALKPENANSWELGLQQYWLARTLTASATYFGRATRDLITFSGYPGVYSNVGRASAEGVELSAQWRPSDPFSLTANYTLDAARDVTDRKPLARRPRYVANLAATYVWPVKLSTTLALRYSGEAHDTGYDASFNTIPILLKAYSVVDLRASYPLSEKLEVFGRVENLLNQHYETAYPYGAPGIGGFVGLRAKY